MSVLALSAHQTGRQIIVKKKQDTTGHCKFRNMQGRQRMHVAADVLALTIREGQDSETDTRKTSVTGTTRCRFTKDLEGPGQQANVCPESS